MAVTVPFGQYVPGESVIHRVEPRAKLVATLAFTVGLFFVHTWLGLAVFALVALVAVRLSGISLRLVGRGVRPALFLIGFVVLANALVWRLSEGVLVQAGPLGVSSSGLARGLFFGARIVLLIVGTTLLTLTTSPVALTDAIARLLRPLERLGFPSGDVAMMLSIALRFIPATAEEAENIIFAQAARGATFDEGGPIARMKAYLPVLVPLFVGLFRRANDLALAMDARCYRGKGRTRLTQSTLALSDWMVAVVSVGVAVAVGVYL